MIIQSHTRLIFKPGLIKSPRNTINAKLITDTSKKPRSIAFESLITSPILLTKNKIPPPIKAMRMIVKAIIMSQ